ncbi:hypothetical protein Ancab_040436 [Ancistrocladus abbreviatus]
MAGFETSSSYPPQSRYIKMFSHYFPEEVRINILSRLPIKSLVRFQCVSKIWHALIGSPRFKVDHYHYIASNSDGQILVQNRGREINKFSLLDDSLHVFAQLKFPFQFAEYPSFISICNGVFCIYFSYEHKIILWNPAIREVRVLQDYPIEYQEDEISSAHFGFGFDAATNGYKVVRVLPYRDQGRNYIPHKVGVYTLRNNKWREIKGPRPTRCDHLSAETYAQGAFHWLLGTNNESAWPLDANNEIYQSILSFDMTDEMFYWICLPDVSSGRSVNLSSLNNFLATIFHSFFGPEKCYDVWVRNGNHIDGSWTKQYCIKASLGVARPRLLWKSQIFALTNAEGKLVSYDLHTEEVGDIHANEPLAAFDIFIYHASLFSVKC